MPALASEFVLNQALVSTFFTIKVKVKVFIGHWCGSPEIYIRASHMQLFWIFMLFQAVNTVKLNFKAGLFSSTLLFEHSFLAKLHL